MPFFYICISFSHQNSIINRQFVLTTENAQPMFGMPERLDSWNDRKAGMAETLNDRIAGMTGKLERPTA
jgi:hypothetical protein